MFKKKVKTAECFSANGWKVGDVVEFFKDGRWYTGEIEQSSSDGKMIIWAFEKWTYGTVGEVEIRQTADGFKKAREYWQVKAQELQDKIDHRDDKIQLAEYRAKIKSLKTTPSSKKLRRKN